MGITEKNITICGHGSGTPSTKVMYNYLETRYKSKADNGKNKGIVKVMRLKAMTDTGRTKFHDKYKTIIGRNKYDQSRRSYVYTKHSDGNYYSDCSSSGCATYKAIGYSNVSLLNTAGIYQSSLFEEVPVKIKNGHITNPEILKVGDALLFVGNDPKRPLQIGHVEYVYEIKEEPKKTTINNMTTSNTNKTNTTTSKYYPKCSKTYRSIVDALLSVGEKNTSLANRKAIAKTNKIDTTTSTTTMNNKLLSKLKAGTLLRV